MAKLKIVTGEDSEILRTVCEEVREFGGGLKKFVKNLKETMEAADGLGIAAPQVGENQRVFIVTLGHGTTNKKVMAMVNPEIIRHSDDMVVGEEGCLSLPGKYGKVDRWKEIEVHFQNEEGASMAMKLSELDARVVQHELDHLNGVLFIDKLVGELEENKEGVM